MSASEVGSFVAGTHSMPRPRMTYYSGRLRTGWTTWRGSPAARGRRLNSTPRRGHVAPPKSIENPTSGRLDRAWFLPGATGTSPHHRVRTRPAQRPGRGAQEARTVMPQCRATLLAQRSAEHRARPNRAAVRCWPGMPSGLAHPDQGASWRVVSRIPTRCQPPPTPNRPPSTLVDSRPSS